MVGDKQKYNVVLITLTNDGWSGDLAGGDDLVGAVRTTQAIFSNF